MGRHKEVYSDIEIAQLKIELYCQACYSSFYKENTKKGQLSHLFNKHMKTKKHKLNTERFRMELEDKFKYMNNDDKLSMNDTNSKLEVMDDDTTITITKIEPSIDHSNDDNLTSISSVINKNCVLEKKLGDLSDTNSVLLSNYNEIDSRTQQMSEILSETNIKLVKSIDELGLELKNIKEQLKNTKKSKNVSFNNDNNDDDNDDNKIEICELILEQGKLLTTNSNLLDIKNLLKNICKQIIKLLSKEDTEIYELIISQYKILNKCLYKSDSREKLLQLYEKLVKLSGDQL
jgi:hypothetical protein